MKTVFGDLSTAEVAQCGHESLTTDLVTEATYFSDSDCIEYISRDGLAIYRRVDETLTLVFDDTRTSLIGFKLKGIRNNYEKWRQTKQVLERPAFVDMVSVLEEICCALGDALTGNAERTRAYRAAVNLAADKHAQLRIQL